MLLTKFHNWYDDVVEPYKLLITLLIASPLIAGSFLPHLAMTVGVILMGYLFITRVLYINSNRKNG
jgi:hypothetical protein